MRECKLLIWILVFFFIVDFAICAPEIISDEKVDWSWNGTSRVLSANGLIKEATVRIPTSDFRGVVSSPELYIREDGDWSKASAYTVSRRTKRVFAPELSDGSKVEVREYEKGRERTFNSVSLEDGYWVFRVEHFSDYYVDSSNFSSLQACWAKINSTTSDCVVILSDYEEDFLVEPKWLNASRADFNMTDVVLAFDFETESGSFSDLSDQGNDGTISGDVNSTTGHYGNASVYDGDGDYVEAQGLPEWLENFTLSFWFKTPSPNQVRSNIITFEDDSVGRSIDFSVDEGNFIVYGSSGVGAHLSHSVANSVWVHVVVTQLREEDKRVLYWDGERVSSDTDSNFNNPGKGIGVGGEHTTPTDFLNGSVDSVRVWNRSLSAGEVDRVYVSGMKNFYFDDTGSTQVDNRTRVLGGNVSIDFSGASLDVGIENNPSVCEDVVFWLNGTGNYTFRNLSLHLGSTAHAFGIPHNITSLKIENISTQAAYRGAGSLSYTKLFSALSVFDLDLLNVSDGAKEASAYSLIEDAVMTDSGLYFDGGGVNWSVSGGELQTSSGSGLNDSTISGTAFINGFDWLESVNVSGGSMGSGSAEYYDCRFSSLTLSESVGDCSGSLFENVTFTGSIPRLLGDGGDCEVNDSVVGDGKDLLISGSDWFLHNLSFSGSGHLSITGDSNVLQDVQASSSFSPVIEISGGTKNNITGGTIRETLRFFGSGSDDNIIQNVTFNRTSAGDCILFWDSGQENNTIRYNDFRNCGSRIYNEEFRVSFSPLSNSGINFSDCIRTVDSAGNFKLKFTRGQSEKEAMIADGTSNFTRLWLLTDDDSPVLGCGAYANATVYVEDGYPNGCSALAGVYGGTCVFVVEDEPVWTAQGSTSNYTFNESILDDAPVVEGHESPPYIRYHDYYTQDNFSLNNDNGAGSNNLTGNTFWQEDQNEEWVMNNTGSNWNIWLNNFYDAGVNDTGTGTSYCINSEGNFYEESLTPEDGDCGQANFTMTFSTENKTFSNLTWNETSSIPTVYYDILINDNNFYKVRDRFKAGDTSGFYNFNKNESPTVGNKKTLRREGDVEWNETGGFDRSGAFEFDGINDYLHRPVVSSASEFFNYTDAFVSVWVKPRGSTGTYSNVYNAEGIITESDGYFGIYRGVIGGNDRIWVYNWDGDEDKIGIEYDNNDWNHIILYHKKGRLVAYKNGLLQDNISSGDTTSLSGEIELGRNAYKSRYFNGSIDNPSFFNKSLNISVSLQEYANMEFRNNEANHNLTLIPFVIHNGDRYNESRQDFYGFLLNWTGIQVNIGNNQVTAERFEPKNMTAKCVEPEGQNSTAGIWKVTNNIALNITSLNVRVNKTVPPGYELVYNNESNCNGVALNKSYQNITEVWYEYGESFYIWSFANLSNPSVTFPYGIDFNATVRNE